MMEALTAMMYAMVKNVVIPARISVTTVLKAKDTTEGRPPNDVVQMGDVITNETHLAIGHQ